MSVVLHGTTLKRAKRIHDLGPNPDFVEPNGIGRAEGFSTCLESGPFPLGHASEYAIGKAKEFPTEGGPAILAVDVPDEIIDAAVSSFFPRSQGVIQFDLGAGLEELLQSWPVLTKEIRSLGAA